MKILIVEDDPVLLDGLTRSLRRSAYAVDCVRNGSEADHALAIQNYSLVILDLGLPVIDGLEVLRRLRLRKTRTPVLILTARELGVLEILLMRAGRVVSKEQLTEHLYGWGDEVSYNAIEVYVHRLRKKLEEAGAQIRTIRGLGYL